MRPLLYFAHILIILDHFRYAQSQINIPDYYYDFSDVTTINGVDYILDLYEQNINKAFLIGPINGYCSTQLHAPTKGPDGLQFTQYSQTSVLPNATQLGLTSSIAIAMWVKDLPENDYQFDNLYLSLTLSDSYYKSPRIQIGKWKYNSPVKTRFFIDYTDYNYYQRDEYISNVDNNAGWKMFSMTAVASNPNSIYIRIKTFDQTDYISFPLAYSLPQFNSNLLAFYIGARCNSKQSPGYWGANFIMGRMYMWKSYPALAQSSADLKFNKFMLGYSGNNNCLGTLPCIFCSKDLKLAITQSSYEGKQGILLASWDFDVDYQQYILDSSGNGKHLIKNKVNDSESSEIFKVYLQGYLFEKNGYATAVSNIKLSGLNYFTVEGWIRKYAAGVTATTILDINVLEIFDYVNKKVQFQFKVYYDQSTLSSYFKVQYGQNAPTSILFDGIFQSNEWKYFGVSCSLMFDNYNQVPYINIQAAYNQSTQTQKIPFTTIPDINDDQFVTRIYANTGSLFVKSIKVYNISKTTDEFYASSKSSSDCTGNCPYCPAETGQCIPVCPQQTYSSSCTSCHFVCGHCTGPNINDCVYCTRDTSTGIIYSESFGNCTCSDGQYLDYTNQKCNNCHSNCQTCFGPSQTECLSCTSGMYFVPNTTCVDTCQDPLVAAGTTLGFYPISESNGLKLCATCHPYCQVCSGSSNSECTQCQIGYFLKGSTTCLNECNYGFYPNVTSWTCIACHPDCSSCVDGGNNKCLTCSDPNKVQQDYSCVSSCNVGYYTNSVRMCIKCDSACTDCTAAGTDSCNGCTNGYFLSYNGFSCKTFCSPGTYADVLTNQCFLCHYSCKTCSGGTAMDCTQCQNGYLIRKGACVQSCMPGEFIVNGTCQTCHPYCATCYGIENGQCSTCNTNPVDGYGYFLYSSYCLENCPDKYYPDQLSKTCKPCRSECLTCTSYDYCTSCIYGPYQLNQGECTYFSCLNGQYRVLRPELTCFDCDDSCSSCQGASKFDCLICPTQSQYFEQQCFSCSQQPGMTDPVQEGAVGCVEICGDGFNYGQYKCDDGNLINGDGCSSKCIIEYGWICSGGSQYGPDICTFVKEPIPSLVLINSKNSLFIQFDTQVILQGEVDVNSVSITISGKKDSYNFQWQLNDKYKTNEPLQVIVFDLTFYQSLNGNNDEMVTVKFINSRIYQDPMGNGVQGIPLTGYLNAYTYIDPQAQASLDAAGSNTMLVTLGAMVINLAISLIFGGSISAMWAMVNTIQLISLLPLMNVQFPQITVLVFEKMLSTQGESTAVPNLYFDYGINTSTDYVQEPTLNQRFYDYGWTTSNFLELSGRKVLIWTVLFAFYPLVYYMKKKYSDKHKFCRFWEKVEEKYRYNLILRGVIVSYASMLLAAVLNIFTMKFDSIQNLISLFAAIIFMIILIYLPVQLMNILQRNYSKVHRPKFIKQYSTIVAELDVSKNIRYMYYPVFLMRRAIFSIILVLFANSPKIQIAVFSASALFMCIYIIVIKPQKSKIMIALNAAGELMLLTIHLISIAFLNESISSKTSNQLGWLINVLVGLYILVNWVIIVTVTVIDLRSKCKQQKLLKDKKKLEERKEAKYRKWKKKYQEERRKQKEEEQKKLEERYGQKRNMSIKTKDQVSNDFIEQDPKALSVQIKHEDETFDNNNPFYSPNAYQRLMQRLQYSQDMRIYQSQLSESFRSKKGLVDFENTFEKEYQNFKNQQCLQSNGQNNQIEEEKKQDNDQQDYWN